MPKVDIDYTNTLFYKISCKDTSITDVYIGHTTNFVQRKSAHKHACINPKTTNYACKLYTVIRQHGGWDNWRMDIIAYHECNDNYEARKKEQEYFILYNATLNSIEPMPRPKCVNVPTPVTTNGVKPEYWCKCCNYNTCNKKDYNKHLLTAKHSAQTSSLNARKITSLHECSCGSSYKHIQSYNRHKKICIKVESESHITHLGIDNPTPPQFDAALVLELLKQNQEFKELIAEQNKQMIEQQQHLIAAVNMLRPQ